jgi:indole-3-glycerol phosphate synthase
VTELETAALAAGAWVVRTALAVWLDDRQPHPPADLADALGPHVIGIIERRQLVREFEAAADSVAMRLLDLNLAPDEVAYAVDVLQRADIASDTDRDTSRDPARLFRFARTAIPGWTSADRAVLGICCVALSAILDMLPARADADALAAVLRNSGALSRNVGERLADLPVLDAPESEESFTEHYCASMADRFDRAVTLGASVTTGPVRLTSVFVEPDLLVNTGQDAGARLPLNQVLGTCRRLLVRGGAGAGKSTLLQRLAVSTAREELFGDAGARPVPFLFTLRAFADRRLPEPDEFAELNASRPAGPAPAGWAEGVLRAGTAVVLVDGLDELPVRGRQRAAAWLDHLVWRFPRIRCVVTGRPSASVTIDDTFTVADLAPMTEKAVQDFVRRWYSAFSDETDGARLLSAVAHNRHLSQLATSPLMCALLCALGAARRGPLPRDHSVYEAILDFLLTHLPAQQGSVDYRPSYRETVSLLEQLAFWFVQNDHAEADAAAVSVQLHRTLRSMPHVTGSPDDVLRYLVERTGVLREAVPGRIDFTHPVLRDYLAARAMAGNDTTQLLTEFAHSDRWREVVAMARELLPAGEHATDAGRDKPPAVSERDHRLVMAVDIEGYSEPARTISHQLDIRSGLSEVLREAMRECGVNWERSHREDLGDGLLVVFPPDADESRVMTSLPPLLARYVRKHNAYRSASARLRVRVAVASGTMATDDHGVTGPAATLVFRLLHSQALRGSQRDLDSVVTVIASDQLYRELVSGPIRADFIPCSVHVKETDIKAWLWATGVARAERESSRPARRTSGGLLDGVVDELRRDLAVREAAVPLDVVKKRASRARPARDALTAMRAPGIGVIANLGADLETSPLAYFDHTALARGYADAGACAISVSRSLLPEVRDAVDIPLLHNELIVSSYQVYEARALGADSVVLTVAALDQTALTSLLDRAEALGMVPIVQAGTATEVDRALEAGARIIGLTARNPETLDIDPDTFARLSPLVPMNVAKVAVSAVRGPRDILLFADAGADAVLPDVPPATGDDPVAALSSLIAAGVSRWS